MKIPTDFIPESWSSEKLEDMLKEDKIEKIAKLTSKKYDYYCDICGELAGSVEIIVEHDEKGQSNRHFGQLFLWKMKNRNTK